MACKLLLSLLVCSLAVAALAQPHKPQPTLTIKTTSIPIVGELLLPWWCNCPPLQGGARWGRASRGWCMDVLVCMDVRPSVHLSVHTLPGLPAIATPCHLGGCDSFLMTPWPVLPVPAQAPLTSPTPGRPTSSPPTSRPWGPTPWSPSRPTWLASLPTLVSIGGN